MSTITLNLTEEACQGVADFYAKSDNDQSCEDFVAGMLVDWVQNVMVEKRNRDAIAHAAEAPLPDGGRVMDISNETNVEKLKALAYDEIRQVTLHQQNLQMIEARLVQLAEQSDGAG